MSATELVKKRHVKYFQMCLRLVPARFGSFDTTRLTVAFFAISGLDLLKSLDVLGETGKKSIIDWIYSLQMLPSRDSTDESRCGFRGSTTINITTKEDEITAPPAIPFDCGHIAMTYTGLASLVILGDDLSRVNKTAIINGLKALQLDNGSFRASVDGTENDLRFVYCAAAISYILQDWSGVNVASMLSYIKSCITFDRAFGQGFHAEAHGGLTFCAVATLTLMNQLSSTLSKEEIRRLQKWCLFRQQSGFHGRPNKPEDTCYSFWVGAALKLLDAFHLIDFEQNRDFILSTQDPLMGGLAKYPDNVSDPLHTYTGLGGLALMKEEGLDEINPALNISKRATEFLLKLHNSSSPHS